MYYKLPSNNLYGDEPIEINLPDNWDVYESRIKEEATPALDKADIRTRILHPIGTDRISRCVSEKTSAVIIVDDITRPTPLREIVEILIDEMIYGGVHKENIWLIVASGAHGPMYQEDFERKLGKDIISEFEVYNHNPFGKCLYLGHTSNGIPVEINADVMTADYKIAVGTMMPHSFYGFSGGAKSVLPGTASLKGSLNYRVGEVFQKL